MLQKVKREFPTSFPFNFSFKFKGCTGKYLENFVRRINFKFINNGKVILFFSKWFWAGYRCRGHFTGDVVGQSPPTLNHSSIHSAKPSPPLTSPQKVNGPCMFFPQPWRLTLFMMDEKLLFQLFLHSLYPGGFQLPFDTAAIGCCFSCIFRIVSQHASAPHSPSRNG